MAYAMTKQGSLDNCITYEFICDTIADMNAIENRYKTIGSVAIVLEGESGGMEAYITGSNKQWNNLGMMGNNEDNSTSNLSIYICAQNEVSGGLPSISSPDEHTIYLVATSENSGNLYDEYIYVNNTWEKFGTGNIDLSGYATVANPTFTGNLSNGRKANTIIGINSIAYGTDVTASGYHSQAFGVSTTASEAMAHAEGVSTTASGVQAHAEGASTTASGPQSHTEGGGTSASGAQAHAEGSGSAASGDQAHAEGAGSTAFGSSSHAEGSGTTASGNYSHTEGVNTIASGNCSHAEGSVTTASGLYSHAEGNGTTAFGESSHTEGESTIANGAQSHVFGRFNKADEYSSSLYDSIWEPNHSYAVGDKVILPSGETIYSCKTAHTSASYFNSTKWTNLYFGRMNYIEIVGNGTGISSRSNARTLDWDGNEHLKGDLYVGCDSDSTGGVKIARIPDPPTTDGTYTLQATVASGVVTYTWVAGV